MISVRGRSQIGEGRGREQVLVKKKGGQALDRQDQLIFSPSGEKPGGGAWNNHPPWPYLFLLPLMIQTVLQTSSLQFEFF